MKAHARARALPRRRKPSLAARIRPFWIVAVVVAALAGWGGAWLVRAPSFRIVRVAVDVPIASPVTADEVRAAAGVTPGANVWLLNPRAVAARIEAIPYVDRAAVHRGQFPKPYVELGVTLRRPFACVAAGGAVVTIDSTTRVLQDGCAAGTPTRIDAGAALLPPPGRSINDADVARLLADGKVLADAGVTVRRLALDRWGGVTAVDVAGVTLRFGDDADLAKKAALVGPVRAGIGTRRVVRAIDLRAPGTPVVEFR